MEAHYTHRRRTNLHTMTTSKTILLSLLATVFLIRIWKTGYVFSKQGELKKPEKYNGYSHICWTAFLTWIIYELYQ